MSLAPSAFARRSFVYRELAALGATFGEVRGAACALSCGARPEVEAGRARELALCDLSPLPRAGFKGRDTLAWLAAQEISVGATDNTAAVQADGARAARLAPTEVLVLSDLGVRSTVCERLAAAWSPEPEPGTYPVPRTDASFWFAVSGRHAATTMAKLCGVDLRPHKFADGRIAQTSIARLNAIAIRGDVGGVPVYDVLGDSASASYLWACLVDAMAEFAGAPVGLDALRTLQGGT